MPQVSPMPWLLLFILIIYTCLFISSLNYFHKSYTKLDNKKYSYKKMMW